MGKNTSLLASIISVIVSMLKHPYALIAFIGISAIFAVKWLKQPLDAEITEALMSVDGAQMMMDMSSNGYTLEACIDEQKIHLYSLELDRHKDKNRISLLEPDHIITEFGLTKAELLNYSNNGMMVCTLQHYVSISKVSVSLVEAAVVPIRLTFPYEMLKRIISEDDTSTHQCSDFVNTIAMACPKLTASYVSKKKKL
ncbi:hypothetical protein MN202_12270 [Rheinheimera muenzenbergensis]|uniref:Uncharacterized protein n=1 Tax=Rheinheimera muenzenbergensis TaxID=1193628 RepID=A0ABU8C879_9GAMM